MIFNQTNSKVLYAHYRKSDNQIFYIGYGSSDRPYDTIQRNKYWHRTINKHGFDMDGIIILAENLTEERAKKLEILMISFYGRQCVNEGPLVNITPGGDGGAFVGKDNGMYVDTEYTFQKDDFTIACTMNELRKKFNISSSSAVSGIVNGKRKSCYGWTCLNPKKVFIKSTIKRGYNLSEKHKEKIKMNNGRTDRNIYIFEHLDGTIETCLRIELENKYNLLKRGIYSIVNGKSKSTKGWTCLNPKEPFKSKKGT